MRKISNELSSILREKWIAFYFFAESATSYIFVFVIYKRKV